MTFIKNFESYNSAQFDRIFVANPMAEEFIDEKGLREALSMTDEGFYTTESLDYITNTLTKGGFSSPDDFVIVNELTEALTVKYEGHDTSGDKTIINVNINGKKYGYGEKEGDLDIADVARKFETMLKFSAGRALTWLKKHAELVKGSKTQADSIKEGEEADKMPAVAIADEPESATKAPAEAPEAPVTTVNYEPQHYMFFQNLKIMKDHIEKIMSLDPQGIDALLSDGHDWAADHLATSKDDIEEVCDFFCAKMNK